MSGQNGKPPAPPASAPGEGKEGVGALVLAIGIRDNGELIVQKYAPALQVLKLLGPIMEELRIEAVQDAKRSNRIIVVGKGGI